MVAVSPFVGRTEEVAALLLFQGEAEVRARATVTPAKDDWG
jgi:hypothetical protein